MQIMESSTHPQNRGIKYLNLEVRVHVCTYAVQLFPLLPFLLEKQFYKFNYTGGVEEQDNSKNHDTGELVSRILVCSNI